MESTTLREMYRRATLSRPHFTPAELEGLGTFWIDNYAATAGLAQEFEGELIFGIIPLEGEMAGVPHCLNLSATPFRRRFAVAVQDHGGPIGPCVLARFRVDADNVIWIFAQREKDGSLWHPFSHLEEYVTELGDPDPEPS